MQRDIGSSHYKAPNLQSILAIHNAKGLGVPVISSKDDGLGIMAEDSLYSIERIGESH